MSIFLLFCSAGIIFIIGLLISISLYKNNEKKMAIVIVVIATIISIALIGPILNLIVDYPNELKYELEIKTDSNWDYTLYVPYLKNEKLESKIDIRRGEGDIEYIDITEIQINGSNEALKVEGYGDMTIYGRTQDDGSYTFTMTKERYQTHWVWCNKTNPNQNITIEIHADIIGAGLSWSTTNEVVIYDGWNEIEIEYQSMED